MPTLADTMAAILDNTCPADTLPGGARVFYFDLHCVTATVTAVHEGGAWSVVGCVISD